MIINRTEIKKEEFNAHFNKMKNSIKKCIKGVILTSLLTILLFVCYSLSNINMLLYIAVFLTFGIICVIALLIFLTVTINKNINKIPDVFYFDYEFEKLEFRAKRTIGETVTKSTHLYANLVKVDLINNEYYLYINEMEKFHVKMNGFQNDDIEEFEKLIENVRR